MRWGGSSVRRRGLGLVAAVALAASLQVGVSGSVAGAQSDLGVPRYVFAWHTHEGLQVSWGPVAGAEFYDVRYSSDNGASWSSGASQHVGTSIVVGGVDKSKTLVAGVRAGNALGWGGWRNSHLIPAWPTVESPVASIPEDEGLQPVEQPRPVRALSAPASVAVGMVTGEGPDVDRKNSRWIEELTASWSAVAGATGYEVQCRDRHLGVDQKTIESGSWRACQSTDSGSSTSAVIRSTGGYPLVHWEGYQVRVRGVVDGGNQSPWTTSETAWPVWRVQGWVIARGDGTMTLEWNKPVHAVRYGYRYRAWCSEDRRSWVKCADNVDPATATNADGFIEATATGIINARQYWIKGQAYNTTGSGGETIAGPFEPLFAPAKFTNVTATRASGAISVTIHRPARTWITSYDVECSTNSGVSWAACPGSPFTADLDDSYEDEETLSITAPNATAYQIRARGTNGAGTTPWSDTLEAPALAAPAQVGTITAVRGDGAITVSWAEPSGGWLTYDIECSTDSGTNWTATCTRGTGAVASGTYTETLTGIVNTSAYTIRARAKNSLGTGSWSASASIATTTKPPTPSLSVEPGERGAGKLTLSAKLSANGGDSITKWQYRTKTGNTYGGWNDIANASGTTLTHVLSGLTVGTNYTYQVRAENSVGWSGPSNDATSSPVNLPGTPSNLWAVSNRNGYVAISAQVASSGPRIIRWEYKQRLTTGGTFGTNWTPIYTVSQNHWYLDQRVTGLTNGTSYTFKVRAVSAAGPGPESAEFAGTPQQKTEAPKVQLNLSSSVTEGGAVTVTASFPDSTNSSTVDTTVWIWATANTASGDDYTIGPNLGLTIPAYTQNSTGTVVIYTTGDYLDEDNETITVTGTATNSSTQGVRQPDNVTLTINDNDTSSMVLSKSNLPMTEGATGTYTVRLGSQPTHSVTVTPASNDTTRVTVSPSSLTFTTENWNTAQTVTVTAASDNDGDDNNVNISHRAASTDSKYSSLTLQTLTVAVADDDKPGATAAPTWVPGATSLDVSWSAPTYVGSGDATIAGYEVRHKGSSSSTWTTVTPSPATSTTTTISDLTVGTGYELQVRTKNNSNFWGPWSPTITGYPGAPTAPTSLTATPGNQKLTLSWSDPTQLNGTVIIGWNATYKCGSSEGSKFVQATDKTTEFTGLTNGVSCEVGVSAYGVTALGGAVLGPPATATATPNPPVGS